MSGEQRSKAAVPVDEPRAVVDQQTRTMRHLNDELFRTVRVHLLIAGALLTAVSMLGPASLLPASDATGLDVVFWLGGGSLTVSAVGIWLQQITTTRLSYTDMETVAVDERASGTGDPGELAPDVAESYRDCIEVNDALLREREQDLNETQHLLNVAALTLVLGLLVLMLL